MLTTKIRSTIIALVAAFSFAATMVPASAEASKNDGRFTAYQQARNLGDSVFCQAKASRYDNALKDAAYHAGFDTEQAAKDRGNAIKERTQAGELGCAWA